MPNQIQIQTLTQALDANTDNAYRIHYIRSQNDESDVGFTDLKQRALGILFHLQKSGLRAGDECILLTDNNEFFIDAFWACLYGGIVPVPVAVASNDEHRHKLLRIFNKLQSPHIYTEEKILQKLLDFCDTNNLDNEADRLKQKSFVIESIDDISNAGEQHTAQLDDVAFIQFSSGSTSDPKGVVLTHKNIMTNIRAISEGISTTHDDHLFSWMPLTHDMGMIGFHLTGIVGGISHSIMDTSVFVRRPLLWLTAASEKKATILCSPNFGYKHFLKVYQNKGMEPVDLSSVRTIFNGAEPISIDICEQFLQAMKSFNLKETAMFPVYGLAEASLGVSFPVPDSPLETITVRRNQLSIGDRVDIIEKSRESMTFVLVGKPIRDCHVRITDNNNTELPKNHVGHIQLKGDNVTSGYYNAPEINQTLITQDGWLDTGDTGAFINGQMIITGRIKDIIFVNGQNFYSHDLENILYKLDELELGKVVAGGARNSDNDEDELVIFILYRGDTKAFIPLAKSVRKLINETTGAEVHQVIPVKRIPKTTSGKVQRHLLTQEYINGSFDDTINEINQHLAPVPEATTGENISAQEADTIEAHILQICRNTVTDKTIGLDDNLFEIGISSLALAEIHEQLENDYPGQVEINDLFDYPSIRQIAAFLESKTAS